VTKMPIRAASITRAQYIVFVLRLQGQQECPSDNNFKVFLLIPITSWLNHSLDRRGFSKLKSHYNWWSVSQYVKVSSPLRDLWPDITFCPKVVFWKLLSCLCGAPSLTRGRVCHLSFSA
jgi:hypothetical protein